jgi:hypothetical protein
LRPFPFSFRFGFSSAVHDGPFVADCVCGVSTKGRRWWRPAKEKEEKMQNIITLAALLGRSLSELQALYSSVQQELVCSERGSQARSDALASLENISLAIAQHRSAGLRL